MRRRATETPWLLQGRIALEVTLSGSPLGALAVTRQVRRRSFPGAGLSKMADWLLSFAAGEAGEVGVAAETPSGPVVESLLEHGFAVHSINPKQLDRFRDRISPGGRQGRTGETRACSPWRCGPTRRSAHRDKLCNRTLPPALFHQKGVS